MKFKFGFSKEERTPRESEELKDPRKRKTLKQIGAFVATASLSGSATAESQHRAQGTFRERFEAAEQLLANGITDFQRQAYKPQVSEALAQGINPDLNYPQSIMELLGRLVSAGSAFASGDPKITAHTNLNNMDAWRMYLGLPQLHGTFGISAYQPDKSKDDIYYYTLTVFEDAILDEDRRYFQKKDTEPTTIQRAVERAEFADSLRARNVGGIANNDPEGVMGSFTETLGEDAFGLYYAYYDRWKLDKTPEGTSGIMGQPFEIYNRIYYKPGTFEVIKRESAVEPKKVT